MTTRLRRRRHRWGEEVEPPVPYPLTCTVCGFRLPSNTEELPLCPGPPEERSELARSAPLAPGRGPAPVSPRRAERRAVRGVYGPLCDAVRGSACCVPGCRRPADPAHVRSVGSGRGDFVREEEEEGRWVGNVAPLCRPHHRRYDGEVGGGAGAAFERTHDVDLREEAAAAGAAFAERRGLDLSAREHPYRQLSHRNGAEED